MDEVTIRSSVSIPCEQNSKARTFITFTGFARESEHIAIASACPPDSVPLVRVHSECLTGDIFHSLRCDCGNQLDEAMRRIDEEGGFLLYLRQEGRGIGLYSKMDAYELQDQGFDTFEANRMLHLPEDSRDFHCAAVMLRALGVRRCRLLTNNPEKINALVVAGIEVIPEVTGVFVNEHNRRYIAAKVEHKQHNIAMR
jgi:GTP cyclohydrolase II